MKNIFSFLFTAIFVAGISAQQIQNSEPETKTCGNFKMPIIIPLDDFDSLMVIKPASEDISKIISINPCAKIENEQTESSKTAPFKNLFAPKKQ